MDVADKTLADDVANALNQYLDLGHDAAEVTYQDKIKELQKKIVVASKRAGAHERDQVKQISLAVQTCSLQAAKRRQLQTLRSAETVAICPTMCIQFQDLAWGDYYSGASNIKYPDVRGMRPNVCEEGLIQNMMLFDLLQGHRQQACMFDLPDVSTLVSEKTDKPAIIIPSGGKDAKWLKKVSDEIAADKGKASFWWARFVGDLQVIFLVSNEEIATYESIRAAGVTLVGYNGFGMGFARAVGIHVARKLNRLCFMTDDRTKNLELDGKSVTLSHLEKMPAILEPRLPWISGVSPKGELNILTIINPKTPEPEKPTFSKYFIASKEDKGLFVYCEMLRLRRPETQVGVLTGIIEFKKDKFPLQFMVGFDASNPPYANTAVAYTGAKGASITRMTTCPFYRGLNTPPVQGVPTNGIALDWAHLNGSKRFLNQWDAVKMQDSAMYLLLKLIHDQMAVVAQAKKVAEGESVAKATEDWNKSWLAFDKYIAPWFS
jgi:hypothetical protein